MLGSGKINSILGAHFFLCVVLVWGIRKIKEGHIFFSVRPLCGTYFLSRFSVKALCARSARFARSAPQPAFGRPWRALRWDKCLTVSSTKLSSISPLQSALDRKAKAIPAQKGKISGSVSLSSTLCEGAASKSQLQSSLANGFLPCFPISLHQVKPESITTASLWVA